MKKDFTDISKWDAFFDLIEPCAFKMKNGNSGRYHLGFKAQQIEKAITDSGLTTQDFAGFIKSPYEPDLDDSDNCAVYEDAGINPGDDEYGLIYTEFVALNTYHIKRLQKENEDLKAKIESLEKKIEVLEKAVTGA